MPKHGRKFCLICNPEGNGSNGCEGTEAVGVYYLERTERNQFNSGWIAVCTDCADMIEKYFRVDYFSGETTKRLTDNKDPKILAGPYEHNWDKLNLITIEIEGKAVDHLKCSKCGAEYYHRFMQEVPREGCSVPGDTE